jgi:hypothetical protein
MTYSTQAVGQAVRFTRWLTRLTEYQHAYTIFFYVTTQLSLVEVFGSTTYGLSSYTLLRIFTIDLQAIRSSARCHPMLVHHRKPGLMAFDRIQVLRVHQVK